MPHELNVELKLLGIMKTYTVWFSEPVSYKYLGQKFNKETRRWEDNVPMETVNDCFTFSTLKEAKRMIKEHMDKYAGSCITKTWSNGDWENLGEISLRGSNRTFVANTRQRKESYC